MPALALPAGLWTPQPDHRLPERLRTKLVVLPDGCWEFTGCKDKDGYGTLWPDARNKKKTGSTTSTRAHRVAYEALIGPIPKNLVPDHLCLRKSCSNPWHLELVTNAENIRRYTRTITHCRLGHPLDGLNNLGRRFCTVCHVSSVKSFVERRLAEGCCAICRTNEPASGFKSCQRCLDYQRNLRKNKPPGSCNTGACRRPAEPGFHACERCRKRRGNR